MTLKGGWTVCKECTTHAFAAAREHFIAMLQNEVGVLGGYQGG
jgi:hypothetical protein